jgi:geranylgeranyl pyrophosphate synthase
MKSDLNLLISLCQTRTENLFTEYLKEPASPAALLQEAISYAVFNGGKRIRPLLVYATGLALGSPLENLDPAAAAIELMHAYSLVHDDLPAMDNADTRRGKPSCHKVYGEAVAILAGDALQSLAFQVIIAQPAQILPQQRLKMLGILSDASGINGMAGGQALDMLGADNTLVELLNLYRLKTGALLLASVRMGMVSANLTDETLEAGLINYAECLGLGFQLRDDLLDIESSSAVSGKPQGLDAANNKITYPLLLGVENTRNKIAELHEQALAGIESLGKDGQMLRDISGYLLNRES